MVIARSKKQSNETPAKAEVRVPGITLGKSFEWATTIFDATPVSYAQAGLLPQFGRDERDLYANIKLLAQASGRVLPEELNVPNEYLRSCKSPNQLAR